MDVSMLGHGLGGKSKANCYKCMQHLSEPLEILPPLKRKKNDGRRRYTHRCTAHNCYNGYRPGEVHALISVLSFNQC